MRSTALMVNWSPPHTYNPPPEPELVLPSKVTRVRFMSEDESLMYETRARGRRTRASGREDGEAEARGGDNWEIWRERLREGLSYLCPGPLLFVYE